MRFPRIGDVGTKVGGSRPADGSQGNSGASFDARDREHPWGIYRCVEDHDHHKDSSLGENPNGHPNGGRPSHAKCSRWGSRQCKQQQTASTASTSSRFII